MARRRRPEAGSRRAHTAERVLGPSDVSLLDLVDHLLNQGVVLSGDVVLGVADVDLIYLRVQALLAAADRVLSSRRPRRQAGSAGRRRGPRR